MLISAVSLTCCLLLGGWALPAGDLGLQLQAAREAVEAKRYAEAIAAYENLLRDAPRSLHAPVEFEMAALHAVSGNRDRALTLLERAVRSGFDDCSAVQREELKSLSGDAAVNGLFTRIRISEADQRELHWLKRELLHVSHETKTMITENINRMDTGITVIPQSAIPARETASPAVLFNRELLAMMQQQQKWYVVQADKLRMSHVTKMAIISGGASAQRAALSSLYAHRSAQERLRAIDARQFALPPGVSTQPRPCGAGSGGL